MDVLSNMKDDKAPGDDRIPMKFYKYGPVSLLDLIRKLFGDIWNDADIESSFKRSIIIPIFKKGDSGAVANNRGVSFGNSIMAGIINKRLYEYAYMPIAIVASSFIYVKKPCKYFFCSQINAYYYYIITYLLGCNKKIDKYINYDN